MIFQQNFSILTLVIFLLKILLESASKSSFLALASRSGFGAAISDAAACSSCVLQRGLCKSHRGEWLREGCLALRLRAEY